MKKISGIEGVKGREYNFSMTATTSTHYASAAATGENWRDISKKVLESLEEIRTEGFNPTIGYLYVTDELAEEATSILTLFRSVTGVQHWTGCVAVGVCANGVEYVGVPAISVMIGQIPKDKVRPFQSQGMDYRKLRSDMEPWLNTHDAMLAIIHADAMMDEHPAQAIEEVDALVGGFLVGGLAAGNGEHSIIAREVMDTGISGYVFDADVAVATAVSQGCVPIGELHEISKSDDFVIAYLDGEKPIDVLTRDLKALAFKKTGDDPDKMLQQRMAEVPPELQADLPALMRGEAHIGFPVAGADKQEYLVRNIMAIDPENGMIAVGEHLEDGQKIVFMHRDDDSVRADLSLTLVNLHKRIVHERGEFKPKAALYVSCVARTGVSFRNDGMEGGEMSLIRDILGDVPLTGFYANGEISNNRLYAHTGVLILFF